MIFVHSHQNSCYRLHLISGKLELRSRSHKKLSSEQWSVRSQNHLGARTPRGVVQGPVWERDVPGPCWDESRNWRPAFRNVQSSFTCYGICMCDQWLPSMKRVGVLDTHGERPVMWRRTGHVVRHLWLCSQWDLKTKKIPGPAPPVVCQVLL